MSARRYTEGKLRYELIPNNFLKELAKVYTIGADKYTLKDEEGNIIDDGSDNWRKGLSWKQTLGSIQRHLEKFKDGEDFDSDYPKEYLDKYGPTYHLANAAWGIASLLEFYKIHPELDDRQHAYLKPKRIGVDVDEVVANFIGAYAEMTGRNPSPDHWGYCYDILNNFETWRAHDTLDYFYTNVVKPCCDSKLPFEPVCYITNRPVSSQVTMDWLAKYKFPLKPVYTTKTSEEKVAVALEQKLDYFIDDKYETFVAMNNAGVCCFLMDQPHNRKFNVGYKRILNFDDFKQRFL